MRVPMLAVAALCSAIGLGGFAVVPRLRPAVAQLLRVDPEELSVLLGHTIPLILGVVAAVALAAGLLVAALLVDRARRLRAHPPAASPTWDCGYAAPTARMQYTASSFAEPIVTLFATVLGTRRQGQLPQGPFPAAAQLATETPDMVEVRAWRPAFAAIATGCQRLHGLQHGRVQLYVLYIAAALVALLAWGLW